MCGRYALHSRPEVIALAFGLARLPEFELRYNIAPTAQVLAVRNDGAMLARWGLVPGWAKDASLGVKLCNARAETLAEKPAFRDAWRARHCLIPANGFYEWKQEGGHKQPYYIRPARAEVMAFAGLWERWQGPQGPLETCTIVTTEADEVLRRIHDRMPVIVQPGDYARWLRGTPAESARLLRPCPGSDLVIHRVGLAVNNARNESPELVLPLEPA